MADHLAATYLDRAHDAERTILQLKLELQAACTEVKDAAASENDAHMQRETDLEHDLAEAKKYFMMASDMIEELRMSATQAKQSPAKLAAKNTLLKKELGRVAHEKNLAEADYAELKENFDVVGAEKDMLEAGNAALKEKHRTEEAKKDRVLARFEELSWKLYCIGAEKNLLEVENAALKKELGRVEAKRIALYDELREKLEDHEGNAGDFTAESSPKAPS
ncbi:hypothetical protein LTS10_000125 [Elasticomyces elasticus]|nr:hypothetical protein LTS10_000125 [Elasticomyces elasticus]